MEEEQKIKLREDMQDILSDEELEVFEFISDGKEYNIKQIQRGTDIDINLVNSALRKMVSFSAVNDEHEISEFTKYSLNPNYSSHV